MTRFKREFAGKRGYAPDSLALIKIKYTEHSERIFVIELRFTKLVRIEKKKKNTDL